jgi:hypothetical protein
VKADGFTAIAEQAKAMADTGRCRTAGRQRELGDVSGSDHRVEEYSLQAVPLTRMAARSSPTPPDKVQDLTAQRIIGCVCAAPEVRDVNPKALETALPWTRSTLGPDAETPSMARSQARVGKPSGPNLPLKAT